MSDRFLGAIGQPLGAEYSVWELFHENSKASSHDQPLPAHAVTGQLGQLSESLEFNSYEAIPLPDSIACATAITETIGATRPVESEPHVLGLETLATLLQYGYGLFPNAETDTPGKRRAAISVGSVHALELFVHCSKVMGLAAGLYHYNPLRNNLRLLRRNDYSHSIAAQMRDHRLAYTASAIIFVAAMPERMSVLHGERGYRYLLMEAGAVIQNLVVATTALGLACVATADYFDRQIDAMLGLDGVTISTVCLAGICGAAVDHNSHNQVQLPGTPI